jgi:hypothetical protein
LVGSDGWTPKAAGGVAYNDPLGGLRKGAGVDAAQSDAEREAQAFIEENEPLLEDGGLLTVQRIFVQGVQIIKALSDETVDVANDVTDVANDLAAAIRDPSTSPRAIHELEAEYARMVPLYERKNKAFQQFSDFMDRVEEARYRREAEVGRA